MPFVNENIASKLSKNDRFQVGRANIDNPSINERGLFLPWASDKEASWVYYECAVGAMLDSGLAVHNRLPQVDHAADTLASCFLEDPNLDRLLGGVNLRCNDQYQDIIQRMGHARYWFRLWGQAMRIGYQIPIPGLKTIGGVAAVPYDKNPQWAYNTIAPGGNYGDVILWVARWSLWYTTLVPPTSNRIPSGNTTAHANQDSKTPKNVQVPFSLPDDNAMPVTLRTTTNPFSNR